MHITVLDGEDRGRGTPLDRAVDALVEGALAAGHACVRLRLAELAIHQCRGCFDCWVKTPGRCRLKDDGHRLLEAEAATDRVVLASPLRMGFLSSTLKRAMDRQLPMLLPYIDVVGGECHHALRYGRKVDFSLLLERGDASDEELRATEQICRRLAKNFHGELESTRVIEAAEAARPVPAGPRLTPEVHDALDAR